MTWLALLATVAIMSPGTSEYQRCVAAPRVGHDEPCRMYRAGLLDGHAAQLRANASDLRKRGARVAADELDEMAVELETAPRD